MTDLPKVIGPFRDRNRRGLPIAMRQGFPAWAFKPEQVAAERRVREMQDG